MAGHVSNATTKCEPPQNGVGHGPVCYSTSYYPNHVCLGPERKKIRGRKYDSLENALAGRGPLSTYLKMDVEGSEWTPLERLLENETDLAKIRTLDMEVHFGWTVGLMRGSRSRSKPEEKRLQREVR